jgi:outer membrane protein assembly factor BamB
MFKILGYSLVVIVCFVCIGSSQNTTPPALGDKPVLYRADAERTGLYDLPALREFHDVKWQINIGNTSIGSPLFADGVLYLGTFTTGNKGHVSAYNAQTGAKLWTAGDLGGHVSPVAISGDFLYVGGISEMIQAIDRRTGTLLWSFSTSGAIWNAPLIVGSTIYVISERGAYALDAVTGAPKWQMSTGNHQGFFGAPAYHDGTLYFSVLGKVFALDAETGSPKWQVTLVDFCYALAIGADRLFIGCDNGNFYALNAASGAEVWRFHLTGTAWSAPVIANGSIYVGNEDKNLYALNAETGQVLWKFATEDAAVSDPLLSDGVLYFGVGNHQFIEGPRNLYAIDAQTGLQLWSFKAAGRILTAPALSQGAIYIVAFTGQVYALE